MDEYKLTSESKKLIAEKLLQELSTVSGKKILEFGFTENTLFKELSAGNEFAICIDKFDVFSESTRSEIEKQGIDLIPYEELSEDCYFGRFHLVYTIFKFSDRPHLVDEIMRLRRLIIKGGEMVIADLRKDGLEEEYIKQMKRCGFADATSEPMDFNGMPAFMITARK